MFGFCHLLFIEHISFIKFIAVIERLPWRAALTALPLVRTLGVVAVHVFIKVDLNKSTKSLFVSRHNTKRDLVLLALFIVIFNHSHEVVLLYLLISKC